MESNPFRVIPLLSDSSPRRGNLLFQVQGAHGETAHHRGRLRREPRCGFGFVMYTCIRILQILIYVLYKSKLLTLVTIGHSWCVLWIL